MKTSIKQAIQHLYDTFSIYPLNKGISYCTCCIRPNDIKELQSKPLRALNDEDLTRYAHKCMTTWGSVNDFKHYVPRLFELTVSPNSLIDLHDLIGKLSYADWKHWPDREQESIKKFIEAFWNYRSNHSSFDAILLLDIASIYTNINTLLQSWKIDIENKFTVNNFLNIIIDYTAIYNRKGPFKTLSNHDIVALTNWIERNYELLYDAFYFYESIDEELSNQISYTIDIVEQAITYK